MNKIQVPYYWSFLMVSAMAIIFACSGKKELAIHQLSPIISSHYKCEIISTDISAFPDVILRAIVLDENNEMVLNLAPPYGHHDDWQIVWRPIMTEHPKWGREKLIDFMVSETQYFGIDSVRLANLLERKDSLKSAIAEEEEKIQESIDLVNERKKQRNSNKTEQERKTSLVFVMDISGSMRGEPLHKAKRAAIEFLKYCDAEVSIVAFDHQIHQVMNFSHNRDSLVESFLNLKTIGGTQLYDALYHALNMLSEKKGFKHIIALTDGQTSGDSASFQDVIRKAGQINTNIETKTGDSTNIFSIGYNYENDDLLRLSEHTGGKFYKAASDSDLLEAFSDYLDLDLEFTSPDILLHQKLNAIIKEIEIVQDSVFKNYHYDISFTLPFSIEDGMEQIVSLNFAHQLITHPLPAPISTKEFVLQGYITDQIDSDSISDAIIVVNPHNILKTFTCQSDSTGYYEILVNKVEGKYSVIVYADDYFIVTEEHKLANKNKYFVNLDLKLPRIEKDLIVTLRTIHFENNEFLFEPISFNDLIELTDYFISRPEFVIEVGGHTDSYGSNSYNQWLSERRAEIVAEYIAGLGFPESNISSKGYGESQLLVPDDSPENRYANRRVEIRLVDIIDAFGQ
jgi:outer membrane protein OmpA-like peptidoglycan-associated protein/Mg-chelatase subunit ChlD